MTRTEINIRFTSARVGGFFHQLILPSIIPFCLSWLNVFTDMIKYLIHELNR